MKFPSISKHALISLIVACILHQSATLFSFNIINYSPKDIGSSAYVDSIQQNSEGILYISTDEDTLSFDGKDWSLVANQIQRPYFAHEHR